MTESQSGSVETHLRASVDAQRRGDFDAMLAEAEQARDADRENWQARFRVLECLLYCGHVDRVRAELERLEQLAASDHVLLGKIAEFHSHCADHEAALRCYRRAVELQPRQPDYLFSLAAAELATGDIDVAERHLTAVIELNPHDYDAYRNRSTLRKQTADSNHIDEIERLLESGTRTAAGEAQLCYALAKEYEDLGADEQAFEYLKRGADKRRSIMNYQVEGDVAVMSRLRSVFDAELFTGEHNGCDETGPIFVMGLPRSGTTLVDRILSSHSQVDSLGEINNFAYALMHTIGRAADKLALIELSAMIDFKELGQRYVHAVRSYGKQGPLFIDKTPLNYLYIGYILLAVVVLLFFI